MPEKNDSSMQDLKPTVWIGKQGCSGTMIEEIVAQLKKRKLIKVKWLQNTEVDPKAVASEAKAKLVEVRGRTMVLEATGKVSGTTRPAGKATVKAMGKLAAKVPVKATAKVTARAAAKSPVKSTEKAPAKTAETVKPRQTGALKRAKR
jgi:RNA-binding protein